MDTRLKIVLSAGIVLGGLLLAMLFRQHGPATDATQPSADEHLVLHRQPEASQPVVTAPAPAEKGATVLKPIGQKPAEGLTPPPDLPKSYAAGSQQGTSRWGISMGQVLPDTARSAPPALKHKIVDGDSLSSLAERYLGSADRATEIFEANREKLSDPRILPIGLELRIPR
jgi:nucleoid-associated protein YgaU